MPLLCTVEGGLGDREPPDGSKQPDSMQDINERGQESSDWGEKIAGGDDVIACGGVDSSVDEQGNGRQISRETEEGFDNMENLEVLDEVLGEGEFGIVYKGRYGKDGNVTDVAVKKLKGTKNGSTDTPTYKTSTRQFLNAVVYLYMFFYELTGHSMWFQPKKIQTAALDI